jgi:hypothetical protein
MDNDNHKQEQFMPHANLLENKSKEIQNTNMNKQRKWIYYMEERRKEVVQMLAQGHNGKIC